MVLHTWTKESSHNYENNCHEVSVFVSPGATYFEVEFDERCETEKRWDSHILLSQAMMDQKWEKGSDRDYAFTGMIIWNLPTLEVEKHVMTQKLALINGPRWVVFSERDKMPTSVSSLLLWHPSGVIDVCLWKDPFILYIYKRKGLYQNSADNCHLFLNNFFFLTQPCPLFTYQL